jgi:hypothetical protein
MISKHAAVTSVVMCALILWTSPSKAELGGTSPRWSETDIASLNADLVTLLVAEYRLRLIKRDVSKAQGRIRQNELLGIDDEGLNYAETLRTWWLANVVDPAMRIAGNPAAPCRLAQIVLTKLLEAERQAQLLGMASGPGGDLNDPDSVISRAFKAVKRRCLEQAYDACLASGNGEHILLMLAAAVRQLQLLAMEDADFEAQAIYLYRRCTVYQLRYHSQSQFDDGSFAIESQSDGSLILLSDVDPTQGYLGLQQPHEWRGPRPNDPIDALGVTTKCQSRSKGFSYVCGSPVAKGTRGFARIKAGELAMKRFYDDIEVNLSNDETELEELTRLAKRIPKKPPITWARKSEGTNGLTVAVSPWPLQTPVTIRYDPRLPPVPVPFPDSLITFVVAHLHGVFTGAEGVPVKDWTRAGHNVLFEKNLPDKHTDGRIVYADTTKFELVHRPDLFPSDEIVANWELTSAPEAPAPSRTPAQPGAAPR